jgi:hypothetical protein
MIKSRRADVRARIRTATTRAVLASLVVAAIASSEAYGSPTPRLHAGPESGIVLSRGNANPHGGGSPQLLYHGGSVLTVNAQVTAVFWGPSWASQSFAADKITGLDSFYSGVGGTAYVGTNTEYTDSTGNVPSSVSYSGHVFDPSDPGKHAPRVSDVLAAVARSVPNPVANAYYPVYSDQPPGHAGYCAWHSAGTINGVPIEFGFFFNLDGVPGCDPRDTSGLHSQGLSALANVSGHELSETLTDPQLDGWYDSTGAENADKCAWTFGSSLLRFRNKTMWKIQGNWSNAAYLNGGSYLGAGSGCIDGGP